MYKVFIRSDTESSKPVYSFYSSWDLQSFKVPGMAAIYPARECALQMYNIMLPYNCESQCSQFDD